MTIKPQSQVDYWLKKATPHQTKALENASRYFNQNDAFTVNTLEAIYGQESDFGTNLRTPGIIGAAGHFQIERNTAERYGATNITKKNDPRFDIDNSSEIAARYIVDINSYFIKATPLTKNLKTIAIKNIDERKLFVIASYNAGEGRIAKAQEEAKKAGKNPEIWEDVKNYLEAAGASRSKVEEIIKYVKKVTEHEKELSKKSPANKKLKDKEPKKLSSIEDGNWVTFEGRHILMKKKA